MRLKTYHSAAVESAIRLARIELGDAAVFLGSQRNDGAAEPGQAYQVTFAVLDDPAEAETPVWAPAMQSSGALSGALGEAPREAKPVGRGGATLGPAPGRARIAPDHGAPVNWQELLRQVSADDTAANPSLRTLALGAPLTSSRSIRRAVARPHWKQFVPIEHRGSSGAAAAELKAAQPAVGQLAASAPLPAEVNQAAHTLSSSRPPAVVRQPGGPLEPSLAPAAPRREQPPAPLLEQMFRVLTRNGIESALAARLVQAILPAAQAGADATTLRQLLFEQLRALWKTDSVVGRAGAARKIAALVGPAGSGKTAALAKLAFRYGVFRRQRVRFVSVDQLRVGAVEPLHAYAGLMGVDLRVVDDFAALAAALDGPCAGGPQEELLLVDTPGYGRRDGDRARHLAALFLERGDIDVHLVLDARNRGEELHRSCERFALFRPAKLLFTRLDECSTIGAMLSQVVRAALPLSYVGVGQRVPEDLVPAAEPSLLRLLFKDRSAL